MFGLKPYKEMTQETHDKLMTRISMLNPSTFWPAMESTIGIRWKSGNFGGKLAVYFERFNKASGERIGSQITKKSKGSGTILVQFLGELSSRVQLLPSEMTTYAESGKPRTIKATLPMIKPGDEGYNPVFDSSTGATHAFWYKVFNDDLIEFLSTAKTPEGMLVGKVLCGNKYDQVIADQLEAGITDPAKHAAAFAKELKKCLLASDSTLLRQFDVMTALKADALEPNWDVTTDSKTAGVLDSVTMSKLAAWRAHFGGDVAQRDEINKFRALIAANDRRSAAALVAMWIAKYDGDAPKQDLFVKLARLASVPGAMMSSDLTTRLSAFEAECAPNTNEMSALDTIEQHLLDSTDPATKSKNPRVFNPMAFIAGETDITHIQATTIPLYKAPVVVAVEIGKLRVTDINGSLQLTNAVSVKALTILRQGQASGTGGTLSMAVGDCFSDDDDDDDDAADAAAADAVETATPVVDITPVKSAATPVVEPVTEPAANPVVEPVADGDVVNGNGKREAEAESVAVDVDDDDVEDDSAAVAAAASAKRAKKAAKRLGTGKLPSGYVRNSPSSGAE
jgi:hypothetical protein